MEALFRRLLAAGARRILRSAGRRALGGEYWAWGAVALAGLVLRRVRTKSDPVLSTRRLKPGDSYLITLRDPTQAAEQPTA